VNVTDRQLVIDAARRQLVMEALARFAEGPGSTVVQLVDVGTGWRVSNAWIYRVHDEVALRAGVSPGTLLRTNVTRDTESLLRAAGLLADHRVAGGA
jgi:hypothetical protein